jgi:hypothetical protein
VVLLNRSIIQIYIGGTNRPFWVRIREHRHSFILKLTGKSELDEGRRARWKQVRVSETESINVCSKAQRIGPQGLCHESDKSALSGILSLWIPLISVKIIKTQGSLIWLRYPQLFFRGGGGKVGEMLGEVILSYVILASNR